jgi:uncharacterized membrane protein
VPAPAIDEIVADYSAHFDEGAAAKRGDADIAAALGDPLSLAEELRMEMNIERFEATPSPRAAADVVSNAVARFVARGMLNLFVLCFIGPLLALLALGTCLAIITAIGAGIWILFAGTSLELPGGFATTLLCGLGLLSAAVSLSALLVLAAKAMVGGLARYTRYQYRFLSTSRPGTNS